MTDPPTIEIPDPFAQTVMWGPCRLLNRDERPSDEIVGERVAVRSSGVDHRYTVPPQDLRKMDDWGDYEPSLDRHHPGKIIGTVKVLGHFLDTDTCTGHDLRGAETEEYGVYRFGDWQDFMTEHLIGGMWPALRSNPWWSDSTDVAWLLDSPKPCEPVDAVGAMEVQP